MNDLNPELRERIAAVRGRIAAAAARVGRDPGEITLVAVSKTVDAPQILAAHREGLTDFGENRVQEAAAKIPLLAAQGCKPKWHLIGHLQSNKAKRAMELFDIVQSVDDLELARRLDRFAMEQARKLPVYLEINLGEEQAKSGFRASTIDDVIPELARLTHLTYLGLMVIPPFLPDPEQVRPYFRRARDLMTRLNQGKFSPVPLIGLSMGMSHDFEVAIEEGATLVRVGTSIFGRRPKVD